MEPTPYDHIIINSINNNYFKIKLIIIFQGVSGPRGYKVTTPPIAHG